jgi:hypothetical protein
MHEKIGWKPRWTFRKYASDADFAAGRAYEEAVVDGNLLLNEGITEALSLITGLTATPYSAANARIGVGDSNTAAAATQTGLQAATNKLWKGMEATYPQVAAQTATFRAVFGSAEANYAWQEFTITNAADDSGENLNRLVSNQGTKASGQTWTIDVTLSLS